MFISLIAIINPRLPFSFIDKKKKMNFPDLQNYIDASLMTPSLTNRNYPYKKYIIFCTFPVCIIYVHILHIISNKYWHKILCSFITEHGICNVVTFESNQTKTQSFWWSMLCICEQIKCGNIYDWLYTSSIPWLLRKSFHFS